MLEEVVLSILVKFPAGLVVGEMFEVLHVVGYFFATRFDFFTGF